MKTPEQIARTVARESEYTSQFSEKDLCRAATLAFAECEKGHAERTKLIERIEKKLGIIEKDLLESNSLSSLLGVVTRANGYKEGFSKGKAKGRKEGRRQLAKELLEKLNKVHYDCNTFRKETKELLEKETAKAAAPKDTFQAVQEEGASAADIFLPFTEGLNKSVKLRRK